MVFWPLRNSQFLSTFIIKTCETRQKDNVSISTSPWVLINISPLLLLRPAAVLPYDDDDVTPDGV